MKKNKSIINKLLWITLIVGILFSGISNFFNTSYLLNKFEDGIHNRNQLLVDAVSYSLESDLMHIETAVDTIAVMTQNRFSSYTDGKLPNMNDEEKFYLGFFDAMLNSDDVLCNSVYIYFNPELDGEVHDVWLNVHPDGEIRRELEIPLERYINNDNMSWFFGPEKTGCSEWVEPYYNRYGQYITSYVVPIFVDDQFIAITGMYLGLDNFKSSLDRLNSDANNNFWLYNNFNEVIFHESFPDGTEVDEVMKESLDKDGLFSMMTIQNKQYVTYKEALSNGWTIVYNIHHTIIKTAKRNIILLTLLIFVLTVLAITSVFHIYARRFKRVFNKIVATLNDIKKGQLGRKIDIERNDELGVMIDAINDSNQSLLYAMDEKNRLAYKNLITNLPNRNRLTEDISSYFDCNNSNPITLVHVDIDEFRGINEMLGMELADCFVYDVGKTLYECEMENVKLYHTNVDEFVFVLKGQLTDEELYSFSQGILKSFGINVEFKNYQFYITISIGIARKTDKTKSAEHLYKDAGVALHEAKKKGRNHVVLYDESLYEALMDYNKFEHDFINAIKNNEFLLHYQPQYHVDTNEIVGYEALVRWEHAQKGLIYPNNFIPYAEKSGYINQLGLFVLQKVCEQINIWKDTLLVNQRIGLNLSVKQLQNPSFIGAVKRVIEDTCVDTKYLEMEITESMFMQDSESNINKILQLKEMGIYVSLDDFGFGFSSLYCINSLPVDKIKIDKSLIDSCTTSHKVKVLLETTIAMTQKLNIEVIAEGVENIDQVNLLRDLGCKVIQGYYYSKPIDVKTVELLNNRK